MATGRKPQFYLGALAVALIFLVGRAHYFIPELPKFYFKSYDGIWWLGFQRNIAIPELYKDDEFVKNREKWRFAGDRRIAHAVVSVAQSTHISRRNINNVLTAAFYLFALISVYLLLIEVNRSRLWSAIGTFAVSQSAYFVFLRYDVVVPKMFGFMLFPLVVLAVIHVSRNRNAAFFFAAVASIAALLYPGSTVYYLPSLLAGSSLAAWLSARSYDPGPARRSVIHRYVSGVLILTGMLFLATQGKIGLEPPPLEITEYFYRNHLFRSDDVYNYLQNYGIYLAGAAIAYFFTLSHGETRQKRTAHILFIIGVLILLSGIIGHVLSGSVDSLRMAWYWRASYYCIPVLIALITLGLSTFQRVSRGRGPCRLSVTLVLLSILLAPRASSTAKGAFKTWGEFLVGGLSGDYSKEIAPLITAVNTLPADAVVLFPKKKYQGLETDVVEAEIARRAIMSRSNMGLMIVNTPITAEYYNLLKENDRLYEIDNPCDLTTELIHFGNKLGATVVLFPENHSPQPILEQKYEGKRWLLYDLRDDRRLVEHCGARQ